MTSSISRIITVAGLSVLLMFSALVPSFAGAEGRKNTAVALTALAIVAAFSNNDKSCDRDYRHNDRYRSDYRRDYGYGYRVDIQRDRDYRYKSDDRRDKGYRFDSNNSRDRGRFGSDQWKNDRKQPRGNAFGHDKRGRD